MPPAGQNSEEPRPRPGGPGALKRGGPGKPAHAAKASGRLRVPRPAESKYSSRSGAVALHSPSKVILRGAANALGGGLVARLAEAAEGPDGLGD
eukprot:3963433-Pyramimonas_sp.AAC.1